MSEVARKYIFDAIRYMFTASPISACQISLTYIDRGIFTDEQISEFNELLKKTAGTKAEMSAEVATAVEEAKADSNETVE